MANVEARSKLSATQMRLLVSNVAGIDLTTNYAVMIEPIDIEGYDRTTIQFRNPDGDAQVAQVWGTLFGNPATVVF